MDKDLLLEPCLEPTALHSVVELLSRPGVRTHVVGSRPAWARPLAMCVLTIAMGIVGQAAASEGTYSSIGGGHEEVSQAAHADIGGDEASEFVYSPIGGGHSEEADDMVYSPIGGGKSGASADTLSGGGQDEAENEYTREQILANDLIEREREEAKQKALFNVFGHRLSQEDEYDMCFPIQARAVRARVDHDRVSSVIRVGVNEHGVLDRDRLFSAWSAAGLSEDDAFDLLKAVWASGTYVVGASDIKGHDPKTIEDAFTMMGGDLEKMVPGEAVDWEDAAHAWDRMQSMEGVETGEPGGFSMSDAERALERATNTAGLASLQLPLSAMADPDRMMTYARVIENTNEVLSKLSGWNGQVLGLGGRVNLGLGINSQMIHMHMEGGAGLGMQGDGILVVGAARSLIHEWGHAVKLAVENHIGPDAMGKSNWLGRSASVSVPELVGHLGRLAPDWEVSVKEHAHSHYFGSIEEMMSRSLEMQAVILSQDAGIKIMSWDTHDTGGESYPDLAQARQQSGQWSSWFEYGQVMKLSEAVEGPKTLMALEPAQAVEDPGSVQGLDGAKLDAWRNHKTPKAPEAKTTASVP